MQTQREEVSIDPIFISQIGTISPTSPNSRILVSSAILHERRIYRHGIEDACVVEYCNDLQVWMFPNGEIHIVAKKHNSEDYTTIAHGKHKLGSLPYQYDKKIYDKFRAVSRVSLVECINNLKRRHFEPIGTFFGHTMSRGEAAGHVIRNIPDKGVISEHKYALYGKHGGFSLGTYFLERNSRIEHQYVVERQTEVLRATSIRGIILKENFISEQKFDHREIQRDIYLTLPKYTNESSREKIIKDDITTKIKNWKRANSSAI